MARGAEDEHGLALDMSLFLQATESLCGVSLGARIGGTGRQSNLLRRGLGDSPSAFADHRPLSCY